MPIYYNINLLLSCKKQIKGGMVMLLVLHILLIGFFVGLSIYFTKHERNDCDGRSLGMGAIAVVLTVIFIAIIAASYGNYVGMRNYVDGHILQHDLKALEAVSSTIDNDDNLIAETKDGYYEGLVNGIFKAKERINNYNKDFISKKLIGKNFLLGLYIVEPDDDMKIIDVEKYNYNLGE
jgi:hypothetical protein